MKFDIIFVTYNSAKWINNCIKSIMSSNYDMKKIKLIFIDNNSKDESISLLDKNRKKYITSLDDFIIINNNKNLGFGRANNIAANYGNSDYIFFLNIDTQIKNDTILKLSKSILNSDNNVGMWELSQMPYEHPKYFDPITGSTSWASGACMIVKRKTFEKIGGFDKNIFMYCEDVDLSWNFRKAGNEIKYLFDNKIFHYSYSEKNEFKINQFLYGFINNWYLRAKYGKFKNFLRGVQYVFQMAFLKRNIPYELDQSIKNKLIKKAKLLFIKNILYFTLVNIKNIINNKNFSPSFINGLDYELNKNGSFYEYKKTNNNPLVSIIVRTCNRPNVLRENLLSLKNQTYNNIEIVVVEDGKNVSEDMIKKEFATMNIQYYYTGHNVGRSAAGNLAMSKSTGKYLNFLDDDDVFFPDHVETLVKELEYSNYDIVYASSFETQINIINKNPYLYKVMAKGIHDFSTFSKINLYKKNLFPIQCVMFKKALFIDCGGFDTNIDALEDWDFWIRLSLKHDFNYVDKTTSIFRTPYKIDEKVKRSEFLLSSFEYLHKKFKTYKPDISVEDWYNEERNN